MTRKVYDNGMVAHVWAHRTQETARSNNGNLWFDGDTIYSYRTPVARLIATVTGERVALVTSRSYSITTSAKHMPAVHRALDYGRFLRSFTVPFIGRDGGYTRDTPPAHNMHAANLAALAARYNERRAKLMRMRDLWQSDVEHVAENLRTLEVDVLAYADAFDIEAPALSPDTDAAAIWAHHEKKRARDADPAVQAKRERERERREARKAKQERYAQELRAMQDREYREAWLAGAPHYGRAFRDEHGGAVLRVQGENLQTSLGASVPLQHAVKAFRFIKLVRERGQDWSRNGRTVRVGHFQVDRIDAQGNIHAGCHFIAWPEIERIARELNVIDAPAEDTAEPSDVSGA